jgi:hypothetical protein
MSKVNKDKATKKDAAQPAVAKVGGESGEERELRLSVEAILRAHEQGTNGEPLEQPLVVSNSE